MLPILRRRALVAGLLCTMTLVTATSTSAAAPQDAVAAARAYRQAHEVEILEAFQELLRQPNYGGDLAAINGAAEYIVAEFERRDVTVELLQLPDVPPLIYGEILTPGATRTLGIYVHYDGQPATGPDWVNDPYDPVLYSDRMDRGGQPIAMPMSGEAADPEWRIYARSASDDKAPLPALLTALDALQSAGIELTSNIKFLFEGEEEIGSTHLREYIEAHRDKTRAQPVDDALAEVLRASGREVIAIKGMGILKSIDMGDLAPETNCQFAREMLREAEGAEACLLSCGNWRTLEAIAPLEEEFGIPVITSNQTGLWHALRMSGIAPDEVTGGGRLFELVAP